MEAMAVAASDADFSSSKCKGANGVPWGVDGLGVDTGVGAVL